ncbi:HAD family phosphatase [Candidatus Uhrbacteria bacterium]|nr:HAD family phosphatase [Candidatus Uhrbacteria bacterium]
MMPAALFDLDGTLSRTAWSERLIVAFTEHFPENTKAQLARKEALEVFRAWQFREVSYTTFSDAHVHSLLLFYEGMPYETYLRIVKKTVEESQKKTYLFTRQLLEHVKPTHHTIVITGSNNEVGDILKTYYPFQKFIGSKLEIVDGMITGRVLFSPYYGKEAILKDIASRFDMSRSIAIGDTSLDIPMLEAVSHPIAFNPAYDLAAYAQERAWPIVIERKDTVAVHAHNGLHIFDAHQPIPFDNVLA